VIPSKPGSEVVLEFDRADEIMELAQSNGMQRVIYYETHSAFGSDIPLYDPTHIHFVGFTSMWEDDGLYPIGPPEFEEP